MMRWLTIAASVAALVVGGRAMAQDLPVAIDAGGPGFIYGTLTLPPGEGKAPVVLMVTGSGPIDRNGNSPTPDMKPATFKLLADGLLAHGIGSLRFDKRGVAMSRRALTEEDDLRFDTYVDDVVAWVQFLQTQPRVGCVVLLGHSEGALVAALAAHKAAVCGLVQVAGAGRPAADILAAQLKAAGVAGNFPPELYQQAVQILGELKAGHRVGVTPPELQALFRPSVQPYMISWLKLDPVEALRTATPVLIVQGDADLQVSVDDARLLAAAPQHGKLVILPGVNHVLKAAPADRAGNTATYANPNLPLAPGVVPAIATFVSGLH